MPRPDRNTGGSIGGGFYYGHRTDFSKGEQNVNGGLDNHYYNNVEIKDGIVRVSIKVILTALFIFLLIKAVS